MICIYLIYQLKNMNDLPLEEVIYYQIDRTTRAMRRYSLNQIRKAGFSLTIDQWLVIKSIEEKNHLTQNQLADNIFKDGASVSRIIDSLVKKGMITRTPSDKDRRISLLSLTKEGRFQLERIKLIMSDIRTLGVRNLTDDQVEQTMKVLRVIQEEFIFL